MPRCAGMFLLEQYHKASCSTPPGITGHPDIIGNFHDSFEFVQLRVSKTLNSGLQKVFNFQATHTPELAQVVGDDRHVLGQSMGGN